MKKFSYLVCVLLLLASCQKEEEPTFDKAAMIQNITENSILANYQLFVQESEFLQTSGKTFAETPNEANLSQLQDAWRAANNQWQKCTLFNFGPANDLGLQFAIFFSPTRSNLIENALAESTEVNEEYIESLGAAAKGLPALEYLLFDHTITNEAILETFISSERKRQYVSALTENLYKKANELYNAWQDEYAEAFTNSSSGFKIEVDRLANQLLFLTEIIKNAKIGEPLGKKVGTVPKPEKVEAYLSENSLDNILQNLDIIQQVFNGGEGLGYDDFLNFLNGMYEGEKLSDAINQQIETVRTVLNGIQNPLHQAITEESAQVEQVYTELLQLITLFKADMFSVMGTVVSFSDADGD